MKTKEFLTLLEENPNKNLRFEYHKGQFAREDFHLTEIKNVTYDTVDCGGMLNEWKETIVQIWENTTPDGNYVDTTKALEIAMKVDAVRPIVKDTEVKFVCSTVGSFVCLGAWFVLRSLPLRCDPPSTPSIYIYICMCAYVFCL